MVSDSGNGARLLRARVAACALVGGLLATGLPWPGTASADAAVRLIQPADPFLGVIKPAANAATQGMFGPQVPWPLIPLQAVLLPDGRLVSYGSPPGVAAQRGLAYDVWDPRLGSGANAHRQTASMHDYDSFCNGMTRLPDGRLLMVGGNSTMSTMIFDPATGEQSAGPALSRARWYSTVLRRPDDQILVLGGADYYNSRAFRTPADNSGVALVPDLGDGSGPWSALEGASSTTAFGAADNRWWYPRAYNAPDGSVVGVSADQVWQLDPGADGPDGAGTVGKLATLPTSIGVSGSSVMYRPGEILFAGGGQQYNADSIKATSAATIVKLGNGKVTLSKAKPMARARNWLNLTVLANGEVLANGGTIVGVKSGAGNAVKSSEIWSPRTGSWRTAATAKRIRTYHSVALLMPSGAVFTGGGGIPGPEDNLNAELYYPPYLFAKGSDGVVRWASRPRMTALSGTVDYGSRITLGMSDSRTIASASLISLGTVTHGYNVDQRNIPLTVRQVGSAVTTTLPEDHNVVPPGSYLLQVVDRSGVPSPAQIVTFSKDGPGSVSRLAAPGAGSGSAAGAGSEPAGQPGTRVAMMPGWPVSRGSAEADEANAGCCCCG